MAILSKVTQLVDGVDVVSAKDIMDTQETAIHANQVAENTGSNKANLDASNLSTNDVDKWKEKLGVSETETSSGSLPLGTIISSSIVSDDASLHLLDGSSLLQTGIYKQFCTWLKNRVLANSSNVPTCTISEYATEMTTYGQCGKFVINDTSSDQSSGGYTVYANSIKLPTITEFIASNNGGDAIGLAELDMFKEHNHYVPLSNASLSDSNNTYSPNWDYQKAVTSGIYAYGTGGNETRPKNVRYPYYIVVATSTKTSAEVDINNVTNDINTINSNLNALNNEVLARPFKLIDFSKASNVATNTKSVVSETTLNIPKSGVYKVSYTAVISTSTQTTSFCPYIDGTQYSSAMTNVTSPIRVQGTFFVTLSEGSHLIEFAVVTQSTNATGTFYGYNNAEAVIEYYSSESVGI